MKDLFWSILKLKNMMFFYKVSQNEEKFEIKERDIYTFFNSSLAIYLHLLKERTSLKAKKCKR